MSAFLKFDFQKRKKLRFSEVNYLNYTKINPILHVTTAFPLKQGETRTRSGPISPPKVTKMVSESVKKKKKKKKKANTTLI